MILTHLVIFEFIPGAGEEADAPAAETDKNYVIGMGPMGKTRVHPHPLFSRVKQ
jgi:predicted ATP-grasp superfamily ATP-dependent carboligase